jgi:serine/threonine protein phosphatase PrpC
MEREAREACREEQNILRRELDEMKRENMRLQEKLCKSRSMALLLQRQADEARAERDREHRRAESLHLQAKQLHRQLRRESAKVVNLERTFGAAAKEGTCVSSSNEAVTKLASTEEVLHDFPLSPHGDVERDYEIARPACSGLELAVHIEVDALEDSLATEAGVLSAATVSPCMAGEMVRSWEFVVQGQHDPIEQPDFAPKLVSCFPDDAMERAVGRGAVCVCTRGRRLDSSVPNQDDFLIARHTLANGGHIALYGVFDGHGPAGHHCAAFARGSLPESLFGQHTLLMKPEDTLRHAFRLTQASMLQQSFDTENSGATASMALVLNIPAPHEAALHEVDPDAPLPTISPIPEEASAEASAMIETRSETERSCETWLFVAHLGDCRVLLASQASSDSENLSFSVTQLTRDHRPDDSDEAERIRQEGGEVRKLSRSSAAPRVFACGQDRPALALTRTFGASAATSCGVTAEPEVSAYRLRPGVDTLLVLGTDGLFEFCNQTEAISQLLCNGVTVQALDAICAESRKQWAKSSYNETVDDITAIAVSLPGVI